jgi:hypothetical protein
MSKPATREQVIQALQVAEELLRRKARESYSAFVQYTKPDYDMQWFHRFICKKLDAFERGEIKKMMIFLPPQHGKSELSTRRFPPYLVGKDPNRKVALVSYNDTMAQGFNRSMQRVIDSKAYLEIFPDTKLNDSKFHQVREAEKQRSVHLLEILGAEGSIKTIGRGGSLTGVPVDIGIIDDPIKDRAEAMSVTVRETLYNWYVDVFCTRLHNDSQQLLIQTRWDENDLAGRILKIETDWEVIVLPAIRTNDVNDFDPRQPGEALYPSKHSKEKILSIKKKKPATYDSLYQQDPKPNTEILVFKDWIKILRWPDKINEFSWGLDFGKTTGINALVKGCITAQTTKSKIMRDGKEIEVERHNAYLQEFMYSKGAPVSEIAKALWGNGYVEGQPVYCDHIPSKINELRTDHNIAAYPAIKGPGSVGAGIDKMNEYQVHYIGENIKMETGKYQYVTYDDIITTVPVDDFNHLMDASRYCLLSQFFRE